MLTFQLINTAIPRLQLQDSVGKALQLINDYRLTHLPVVSEEIYLGLLSEEDLLDVEEEKITVEALQSTFNLVCVNENEHFLTAVNCCNQYDTTVVPVVTKDKNFLGVITTTDLLKALGNFTGTNEIGGIIVMERERIQFSISEISRIVESNDATILHLNTTTHPETGMLTISIHLNKKEISSVVATFERYDYTILYSFGDEKFDNEIDTNYKHLMNYLDI
jgi:acetoin utilization protein AcuB